MMQVGADYNIRALDTADSLKSFKTGNAAFAPLKTFLVNQACAFHGSNIAKTYVAVKLKTSANGEKTEDPTLSVLGYITLTCSEIDIRNGYAVDDCTHANSYESLPAIKIARLAVDSRYRSNGIGDQLVALALAIANDLIAPNVGCRFVVTDAKKEAVAFYKKMGFTILETEDNKNAATPVMFVDILKSLGTPLM
ncbi:MAG: GNAT family N-acetyltransferase [Candidatus Nitrotoga sp.]|nr:GNAT family N-acetyltransferase [Candidatus Nitrotoga sp.]MDP1679521.1 GNAT family N-acetyltransferase [Candidatus Nitrotoga sp.]